MTCTYCLVEGRVATAVPAVTAFDGTPVCAACCAHLTSERDRRDAESRSWTESTRALLAG